MTSVTAEGSGRREAGSARAVWLAAIALLVSSCGGAAVAPTASASGTIAGTSTPAPSPTSATPSPASTVAPTPTLTPIPSPSLRTVAPTATGPARADYCAVRDVLTPNREYAEHVRTYLDWTYALPQSYVPPDLVNAVTGAAIRPSPFAIEAIGAAEILARRGDLPTPRFLPTLRARPSADPRSPTSRRCARPRSARALGS